MQNNVNILTDHSGIELEISTKRNYRTCTNIQRLNSILLSDHSFGIIRWVLISSALLLPALGRRQRRLEGRGCRSL